MSKNMAKEENVVEYGRDGQLLDREGHTLTPPSGWAFLPAGDAGLTRKITSHSNYWRVQARMGRRVISKGIWASAERIEAARAEIEAQRSSPEYQRKLAGSRRRRDAKQEAYEDEFYRAVRSYLNFAPCYRRYEQAMARAVTRHAVPVGSGTVARTTRVPLEERVARAVIAWMRHQTTAYESMPIARIKGERRRVRRFLAERSLALLAGYRQGKTMGEGCPLMTALESFVPASEEVETRTTRAVSL
jgi:hypothetical protein